MFVKTVWAPWPTGPNRTEGIPALALKALTQSLLRAIFSYGKSQFPILNLNSPLRLD